jgi:biotin operon repressor
MADKSRIQIVKNLLQEPMYVELLAQRLELTPPTVSFHLKKLMDAGLVQSSKEQYYVVYSLQKDLLNNTLLELITMDSSEQEIQVEREEKYREKIVKSFFHLGKLTQIPVQTEKRRIVLLELAKAFESGKVYTEKEVNLLIADYHDDFCTIRKYMVSEGILERNNGAYTLHL